MKNSISILEFPSNLGLKEPSAGKEPGVKKLPNFLREHNFHAALQPKTVFTLPPPDYSMSLDTISGVRNADAIVQYAKDQSLILEKALFENTFPIVVGGDCSILIGNSFCLKKKGCYGLFFLDGHTDFMWPSLSQTGGAAGMDLAIVSGYGHNKLTNIDGQGPYFKVEHVWCVGNRDYAEWYVKAIASSGINYIDIKTLRKHGIKKCVSGFLQMIKDKGLDGFWIHIDVDVLNDTIMPAVDSRQQGGLDYSEFNEILYLLLADAHATGLEITILDPDLDPGGEYTKKFVQNFCSVVTSTQSS